MPRGGIRISNFDFMPNSSNQDDDDDASLNVVPDDDDDHQLSSCCVPANFNVHSKCIFGLCKYINLNANPVGRERGRQHQKTSWGAQIFNARGEQSGAHYAWAWPPVGGGMWGATFGQCPAWPGEALVGLRGSFRMPLGRPM